MKNILPSLTGLNKTFQTENLNFSIISLAINKCKSKVLKVARDYRVIHQLIEDLNNFPRKVCRDYYYRMGSI